MLEILCSRLLGSFTADRQIVVVQIYTLGEECYYNEAVPRPPKKRPACSSQYWTAPILSVKAFIHAIIKSLAFFLRY